MHRIPTRTCALVAASLLLANAANGQRPTRIQCSINNFADGWSEACSSDQDCSAKYRTHLCDRRYHNFPELCGGSTTGATTSSNEGPAVHPSRAPWAGLAVGTTVGWALGGAQDVGKTEEEKQRDKEEGKASGALTGAVVGGAVGFGLGYAIKEISKLEHPVGRWWQPRRVTTSIDPQPRRLYVWLHW